MLALSLALRREGMLQNGFLYSEISAPVMFISFPAVYLLSTYVLGRGRADVGRSTRELRFLLGERSLSLRALNDSGNLLRDPFSGSRVIVLSAGEAAALFPEKAAELLRRGGDPQQLLPELKALCAAPLWLLPAKTAGQSALLLIFRPDKVFLDGREAQGYVAGLTMEPMYLGGDCRALIGV